METHRLIFVSEVHQPALLEPLSVALLGVLHRLHDAHEGDVRAGGGRRAAKLQRSAPTVLAGTRGREGVVVVGGGGYWCGYTG